MIEIVIVAVIGTVVAGLWDLFTTEVPDQLPLGMVAVGIIYWVASWIIKGDSYPLIVSLLIGTLLLAVGMILYKKHQWGGADAWILAAVGYMIPVYNSEIFIVPYLFNFIIVSIAYTVVYALIVGLLNVRVFSYVAKDLRKNAKFVLGVPAVFLAVVLILTIMRPEFFARFINIFFLIILLVLFWRYAAVIDRRVFRKRISTSMLKKGDVLESGKWVGLTERDIKKLRRTKRSVTIKDGMRFVPVFAITLVLTLLYGNLFFILLS